MDIFTLPLAGFPTRGNGFAVISTGHAADALLPNDEPDQTTILGGLNNSQGNDLVQLTVTLNVPPGAKFWAVDWKFLSEEFPEFVGSEFNDAFLIETPVSNFSINPDATIVAPNNVAFDLNGELVTVNTTGSDGMSEDAAAGTTYDGATETLTTVAPIPSNATTITITFSVMDLGDSNSDAAVFLDNFRFTVASDVFSDVLTDHFARASIDALLAAGITSGCSSEPMLYCPEDLVTRDQMAVFLIRVLGETPVEPPSGIFSDVPIDFAGYIERFQFGVNGGTKQRVTTRALGRVLARMVN